MLKDDYFTSRDKRKKIGVGYQPSEKGYQSKSDLDIENPPCGGSGYPSKSPSSKLPPSEANEKK